MKYVFEVQCAGNVHTYFRNNLGRLLQECGCNLYKFARIEHMKAYNVKVMDGKMRMNAHSEPQPERCINHHPL